MQTRSTAAIDCDLAVLGAGPAGLCLARSAARRGLRVVVVSPDPQRAWPRSYGCFVDELEGLQERDAVQLHFPEPLVWLGEHDRITLPHAYARLSTSRLQQGLLGACRDASVILHDGRALHVEHESEATSIGLDGPDRLRARLLVDASGFESQFVLRGDTHAPAYQAAYGELLEVESHPFAPGEMALMDYRRPDGSAGASETFAYALPLSATQIFVEETCLVSRPAMEYSRLCSRLGQRLQRLGIRVRRQLERELCLIPMGMPLPLRRQRTVAFGAAASLVHPATGYQLARALRLASPLADAIADNLDDGPKRASRAAHEAIWPDADLRAWELYRFGMDFLVEQSPARTADFLRTFFHLPEPTWLAYMTGRMSPSEICSAMLGVFRHATLPLKTQLIRASTGSGGKALLRAARLDNPL